MENASKALIIAGAILLGILIVGLGMYIYNQAVGAMEGVNFDTQQITIYNAPFVRYENKQNGTSVLQLCDQVRAHNSTQKDDSLQIGLSYGSIGLAKANTSADIGKKIPAEQVNLVKAAIKMGKQYTVSFVMSDSGRIISINIAD